MNNRIKADIVDIFSSMQGEGIFLGAKQIFVRFKKCNMTCAFCDEPREQKAKEYTPTELLGQIKFLELSKGPHHSVSLTGGEPLCYTDFLAPFLPLLRKEGLKVYLETNGTLPNELSRIIDLVDIVAMDFKLPSATLGKDFWSEHRAFLKIALAKKAFVKAIVTPDTTRHDIEKAVMLIKESKKNIPFVLQPAGPVRKTDKIIDNESLLKFLEIGMRNNIETIRVIPQIHKVLNIK